MRIDSYEVNNGRVIAVFISDEKRNIKQHKYEPARPHGEWKYNPDCVNDEMQATFFCSICNRGAYSKHDNFCPNCGSDNRKRGEAE